MAELLAQGLAEERLGVGSQALSLDIPEDLLKVRPELRILVARWRVG